jgi:UDP-N-acetylglucosamine transferase subunit ALG13
VIFVTVGNFLAFPRLIKGVESLKAAGIIEDDVLLQVGGALDFRSECCRVVRFLPPDEFERNIQKASVVVSHTGAGTLIQTLKAGKVPVVMPRRKQYGEHVDDHQLEITKVLAEEGRVILANEVEDLPAAIESARTRSTQALVKPPTMMVALVARAIDEMLTGRK